MNLKNIFSAIRERCVSRKSRDGHKTMAAFRRRYLSFKNLLQANADLALNLAKLTQAQQGELILEPRQVRKLARRSVFLCQSMAASLNEMSGNRYPDLEKFCEAIGQRIENELRTHTKGDLRTIALPMEGVDASMAYIMGGKSANLGELHNMLGIRIPRGFALSIKASIIMLLRNGDLFKRIYIHLNKIDEDKPHTVRNAAKAIARLIDNAPVPDSLLKPALQIWDETFGTDSANVRVAVRSSAIAEDGAQSFAGQYESVLGVDRAGFLSAIKKVIGSLYSERALTYRAAHGYPLDATGMGICCLEMVDAKAAGVAFSRHPTDLKSSSVLINGVWGLGEMVVSGAAVPDQWQVSRASGKILQKRIAHKNIKLVPIHTDKGFETGPEYLSAEQADLPSLIDDEVKEIADLALLLEDHYKYPQDLEWAIDKDNKIYLLQTRPLGFDCASSQYSGVECVLPVPENVLPLMTDGDVAAQGIACGAIVRVHPNEDLGHFPEGSILLTENPSPNIMAVLRRAGGVIAENGSLTGHLASLCREFAVPAIFNMPGATKMLQAGQTVTMDALRGQIFSGEVRELLDFKIVPARKPAPNTPALALLRRVAPYILPLRLVDPRSETFDARHCLSIHDAMRFAHEKSYAEMFQISDNFAESGVCGAASKLDCPIPLDLYVIDLGGGLKDPRMPRIKPEDITSVPLSVLLEGMLNPKVQSRGPRPVNMRGFLSVLGNTMSGANPMAGERFGDRSYAIVSDKYLNFSSRVGYHYAILDVWCGETINKNYIRFEFAGGAADDVMRSRRARCIGLILEELGFNVEITGDRVQAKFQKYPRSDIISRLDQLGRLLIMTRQMDMLMISDEMVKVFADKFLNEEYH